jgi:PAS domain S-box-containing protein
MNQNNSKTGCMNGKLYALLLEDVQKDAELLKEMLIEEGFEIQIDVVDKESDYVSCLKTHNYDIIYADFTLPSFNGQEALELAKIICPYVPFICISGTIGEDRAVELLKQGATDYVLKDRMERLAFATKRALDAATQLAKFRKTEIELQTNRRLLQTIINNALDAIYIKDLQGNYLLVNTASEKAVNKTSLEVIGKDDTSFFCTSEAQMIMNLDKKVIESGVPQNFEEIVTLADGNIHIFNTIKCPMFDDFGKPTGLFGIARDITEQKQAEKTLHETQEQYQLLFNSSIDAIFLTAPDGLILSANPSACKMLGRTEEEICMVGMDGIVDTSDPRLSMALEERARTGRFKGELIMIRKDGSKFSADVTSAIFKDKEGHEKTSMIIRDITEQKRAEEAIRREQILLRTLIDNLPDAIYVKDVEGRKLVANSVDLQIMNCEFEDEIIGKTDLEIFDIDVGARGYAEDMCVIQTGQPLLNYEDKFIDKEGKQHCRLTSKIPLFNEQQQIIGLVGVGRDITERKQVEDALYESEKKHRIVADNTYDWEFWLDPHDQFIYCSPSCFRITGYEAREFMANPTLLEQIIHPDDQDRYKLHMKVAEKAVLPSEINFRIVRPDGTERWIGHVCQPILDENWVSMGRRGSNRDITERKKSEEQLLIAKAKAEESDRLKTAFLQNISHEIRTPMNAIVGFSGFLNNTDLDSEKRKNFIEIITKSCDQLLFIISDIISIATIEAGQEKIVEKEIDLNATLIQMNDQFQLEAKRKNVNLQLAPLTDNVDKILSDRTKLVQVLNNLINNALKFTIQGSINFGYTLKENEIEFFVEDSGIGIPPEMHDEIFKRFRQVESTSARQFGGSGLGLSISKAYVELLGGKIWLHSEPGKGSEFFFTIPYKIAPKNTLQEKKTINKLNFEINGLKTLLIAEDEEFNYILLKELLSGININIIRAKNGLEAVEICKSNKHIDMVLMDLKMPLMDGYEATKQIREFMSDLPIIAQTAYFRDEDKIKALTCGCNDFISKPIKRELLFSIIQIHHKKK